MPLRADLLKILLVAFYVRLIAALVHRFVIPLPDSGTDALAYTTLALQWSSQGLSAAISNYPGVGSYFYAWLMSIVTATFGGGPFLFQLCNVIVGVGCVYKATMLASEVWGRKLAIYAGWGVALYPTLIQYSAIPLREPYVAFFLLQGLSSSVLWRAEGDFRHFLFATCSFIFGGLFHAALFFAPVMLAGHAILVGMVPNLKSFLRGRLRIRWVSLTVFSIGCFSIFLSSDVVLPKFGSIEQMLSLEELSSRFSYQQGKELALAKYGDWQVPSSDFDFFWITPMKMIYFMASPFPWDIKSSWQVIGLLDSSAFWLMWLALLADRKNFSLQSNQFLVLFIVLGIMFLFSVGTGNFGTAIRHRSKFVAVIILLSLPKIMRWFRSGVGAKRMRRTEITNDG